MGRAKNRRLRDVPAPVPEPGDLTLSATHLVTPTAEGARAARAFVREALEHWSVEPVTGNAALDVAHELVTNAVQHGRPPIQLTLEQSSAELRVTVADAEPTAARLLPYRPGVSERGLGLRLIAQLSDDWGQRTDANGKSVWATIRYRPTRRGRPRVD